MGLYSWITTGNAVNKDFAFYELPCKLDVFDNETFKKAKTDFYVVMTNVESGKPEYVLIEDALHKWNIKSYISLPFASKNNRNKW